MLTGGADGAASAEMAESLRHVVREVEAHVAASGWDQPARLYALVPTSELLEAEPALAAALGLDAASAAGTLTPIEQEDVAADRSLEQMLSSIMWPPQVYGCAAVVERVVLPPEAEAHVPTDSEELARFAAEHPGRHEVRMAAAVTRDGRAHCAVRLRDHDNDADVIDSSDLVPTLVQLLSDTLAE
ncbi:MAG TPA: PPA1309 family protein [Nocardioidaceae bacterium]|nr:PPA1309 family protein [Nocardioidaceae bacterium]